MGLDTQIVDAEQLIVKHLDLWTSAQTAKSTAGRGSNNKIELTGIKKLRELILELAVRGKLVPQDPNDEQASELLKRIETEKDALVEAGSLKKQKSQLPITDDEKPYELPNGWVWIRLGQIAEAFTGYAFKSSQYTNDGVFVLRVTNINPDGSIEPNDAKYISSSEAQNSYKNFELEDGDVLLVMVGGSLGKIGVVSKNVLPAVLNQNIWKLKRYGGVCRDFFINGIKHINTHQVVVTNSTHGHLAQGEYLSKLMPLAPIAEQSRISIKYKELMALCDQLEQQSYQSIDAHNQLVDTLLQTLVDSANADELACNWQRLSEHFDTLFTTEYSIDALKQTILQLAVMGKLVKQDPTDEPASELLKRIAKEEALVKAGKIKKQKPLLPITDEEKPFELPEGWAREALGNLISISSGDGLTSSQMSPKGTIPVFGGNGINGFHDTGNVNVPTLVIGRVGYYCGSIHITPDTAWVTDNAFTTTFDTRLFDINYLALLLKGTNLKENENATAQPVISGRKLYPIRVSFPPFDEQIRILKKFNKLNSLCDSLKVKICESNVNKAVLAAALVEQVVA